MNSQISQTGIENFDITGQNRYIGDVHQTDDIEKVTSSSHIDVINNKNLFHRLWNKVNGKNTKQIVTLRSLLRYAHPIDIFFMIIAIIAALGRGTAQPLLILVFGNLVQTFINRGTILCSFNRTAIIPQQCSPSIETKSTNFNLEKSLCNITLTNLTDIRFNLKNEATHQAYYVVAIGCGVIILGYIRVAFLSISTERQIRIIRKRLFQAILHKDISFFDTHKTGELGNHLTNDINQIQNGIGVQLGLGVQFIASFLTGVTIGFVKGWKLALVIISFSPVLFASAAIFSKVSISLTTMESKAYGKAGAIAEEVFSSIRTVFAYNGQEREKQRYEKYLNEAEKSTIKRGIISGATTGIMWMIISCGYALGFWYGTKLVRYGEYDIGNVFIIFFAITHAVFDLGQAGPYLQAFKEARAAAYAVWQLIDTPSKLVNDSNTGLKKDQLIGDIQFSNVHFCYPTQPDNLILNGISFNVKRGQTIALVGSSGSGKSTCIQLLQRFYDIDSGSILIDDNQLKEYNLKWLRQHIGVVSQEPILFHTTIRENILLGRPSATDQEIQQAAQMANAHNFIMMLPEKYDTVVGERGSALSGGQKQRIAIARALVRNPAILILDEATSALDNESEIIVQNALDRAAEGRTTLVIAHRLSTIRNADKIIVIHKGEVVEEGNHEILMLNKGIYYDLVEQQNIRKNQEEEEQELERQESVRSWTEEQYPEQRRKMEWIRALSYLSTQTSILDESILKNINKKSSEEDENNKSKKKKVTLAMCKMNKPEWIFIVFGCLASICSGSSHPILSVVLTKLVAVFQQCNINEQEHQVRIYILLFIGIGILRLISMFFQNYLFGRSGGALTKRLRSKTFHSLLRQEIGYFDQSENTVGALCTRLSTDASAVQGATGILIGIILQNISSLGIGIVISFVFSWQMILLVLTFLPFIIGGGILQSHFTTKLENKNKQIFEDIGKISIQSIQNIRTVISLTTEDHFYNEYSHLLDISYRLSIKWTHFLALLSSITNSIVFFCWAALFSLAIYLIDKNLITFQDGLLVFNCIVFGVQSLNQTSLMSSDYGKAKYAAENIFKLLDRKPLIDNGSNEGDQIKDFRGELEFNDVYFVYPNRPEAIILKDFKIKIQSGQKVAFVGTSGCGKSTSIQLIERFYDATLGYLFVDSKDVRTLNLQWYRSQFGIVSQEPILFDMSIKENISYGDNNRNDISMEEIIQAAKDANIHDFIQQLPQGYETNCGAKGCQLSGGQKQRIAIARALIRNPKILLLDEATSALDSESEKVVQDALDRAQQSRTSIIIAHRLSTIQNADLICVIHKGNLVENGTHQELLAMNGRYYRLVHGKLH